MEFHQAFFIGVSLPRALSRDEDASSILPCSFQNDNGLPFSPVLVTIAAESIFFKTDYSKVFKKGEDLFADEVVGYLRIASHRTKSSSASFPELFLQQIPH
jgi:hypothetical protein